MMNKHQKIEWVDIGVLVLFVLLTLGLHWPLSISMDSTLIGLDTDVYINPWADWWTRTALSEGLPLFQTHYLFYPEGVSLVFHSFSHVNTAISLLLWPLVGRFAAYNLTVLLAYMLSGFTMYLLVRHLTQNRSAAFIAGLVFAFHPYHMFEGGHPALASTQWMPLFLLAFMQLLRIPYKGRFWSNWIWGSAVWFVLTALSCWHLMTMLSGWTLLYLVYYFVSEKPSSLKTWGRLLIVALLIAILLAPFLWPFIQEYLQGDTAYMAVRSETVQAQVGLGNDIASFFVPNTGHPILSAYFADINQRIGFTNQRPAYLGYIALLLAGIGVITNWRKTRFFLLSMGVSLFLSLGAQSTYAGEPLHSFQWPWAIPITRLMRHPYRLNILIFLSFSILVGFGVAWLHQQVKTKKRWIAYGVMTFLACIVLFEYLVFPSRNLRPEYSPFI